MKASARLGWIVLALLSAGVALVSYRYLAGVGPLAPDVIENAFARPWLTVHAGAAATALLAGPAQFLPRLRMRRRGLHRWLGRVYVAGCLVGGVTGLVLAAGTTAGPVAGAGFAGLALFWLVATLIAWRLAVARRLEAHRRWMVRSFALTLAAVTLRLYLPLPPLAGVAFMDGYVAIAWLCWVPNVLAAELYLALTARRMPAPG